jgi:hypothetical protein
MALVVSARAMYSVCGSASAMYVICVSASAVFSASGVGNADVGSGGIGRSGESVSGSSLGSSGMYNNGGVQHTNGAMVHLCVCSGGCDSPLSWILVLFVILNDWSMHSLKSSVVLQGWSNYRFEYRID